MTFWTLEMFGALRLSQGKQEITRLRTRKTEALLAYLALFPRSSHTREALAALLWPDAETRAARNSLSVALSALRTVFESGFEADGLLSSPILLTDTAHVRLDLTLLSCDVARFEQALREAQATTNEDRKLSLLHDAIVCYRGSLLPIMYESWIQDERTRLEDLFHESLRQITRLLVKRKEYHPALDYALRAAKLDPLHDADCRNVMRLHAALGNPQEALNHYRAFMQHLQEVLNCAPAAETVAIAEQLTPRLASPQTSSFNPDFSNSHSTNPGQGLTDTPSLDRFFGRETERETLERWLKEGSQAQEATLITLTGMGGIGKTRLVREVVKNLFPIFGSRVHFVSLADITEPAHLFEAICYALRLPRATELAPLEQLAGVFESKPFLLVLDNFEQLADGGDIQVQALRQRLPAMTLLITSRQRLNVAGEREFALLPLPVPLAVGTPERMEDFACVQLFVDRCQQRDADFALSTENVETVAQICARLEGAPLALELAAAWSRALTPQQLLARLEKRFDLLVSNRRDLPPRHRSLRAVLEGSYRLLSPEMQLFFARLSVFAGGWTLEGAEAVCGENALEMLTALKDASLIVIDQDMGDTRRFRFLETLREFAAEHLAEAERADVTEKYTAYFCELAEQGKAALQGSHIAEWCELLEAEIDNFRAILTFCFPEAAGKPHLSATLPPETGVRLAAALLRFWQVRENKSEALRWMGAAFAACEKIPPSDRLVLYRELPDYNDPATKAVYAERALALADAIQDPLLTAIALLSHAQAIFTYPDGKTQAIQELEEAIALFREAKAPRLLGYALSLLGSCYSSLDGKNARAAFEEAIALLRETGDVYWLSTALFEFPFYVLMRESPTQAEAFLQEALLLCERIRHYYGRAHGLWLLGKTIRAHDLASSEACFQESLELHLRYGFQNSTMLPLSELGYTALLKEDYWAARVYFLQWHAGRIEVAPDLQKLLIWCALGERDEIGFRFHCEELLRLAGDSSVSLLLVRQMQFLAAVLKNDFVTARALSAQLAVLLEQDSRLLPQHVSYFCSAWLMAEEGNLQLASQLLGAGTVARKAERAHYLPLMQQVVTQTEARLRASQGEATFLHEYAAGEALNATARRDLLVSLLTHASLPI